MTRLTLYGAYTYHFGKHTFLEQRIFVHNVCGDGNTEREKSKFNLIYYSYYLELDYASILKMFNPEWFLPIWHYKGHNVETSYLFWILNVTFHIRYFLTS